jgi:hypothetical protein
MRSHLTLAAAVATFLVVSAVAAQSQGGGSVPTEIGNRVNGLDYRPTPSGVVPREKVAGIRRPATDERATDETLERIDKELLREEGVSTNFRPEERATDETLERIDNDLLREEAAEERATDQTLERTDNDLLGEEGVSTHSVPKMWSGS